MSNHNTNVYSSNRSALNFKYGDADISSKRRKNQCDIEVYDAVDYKEFKEICSECSLKSTSKNFSPNGKKSDFKGGFLTSSSLSPLLSLSSQINNTWANNPLLITTKPSPTSKGFDNTFKILENQVEMHNKKCVNLMRSLNMEGLTSLVDKRLSLEIEKEDFPSRLELEIDAISSINKFMTQSSAESTSVLFLSFLCDFASKKQIQQILDKYQGGEKCSSGSIEETTNIIYYAGKDNDGNNCLKLVRNLLANEVLCGNRVSQMTRSYDDIEAVTRLLEEKEKDLELTVQIGKELLSQNNTLENRITELEADLKVANDDRTQLVHELHKKNELIAVLTNDGYDSSENDTPILSKSITFNLLQKKIATLQDENKSLKLETFQLASQTDEVEAHERHLMENISSQLNEANSRFDCLSLELERQREENCLQHDQITNLTTRLAETEMRLHQSTHDNDENVTLLNITKENQNSLALELIEFKQRYQEVLALLQEAQEQLRNLRKKSMPQARSSFISNTGHLQPESLQCELMESSLYSDNSLDSGISGDTQRLNERMSRLMSQIPGSYIGVAGANGFSHAFGGLGVSPFKRVFETVRCASKHYNYVDSGNSSMTQLGAMAMSNSVGPRISVIPYRNSSGFDRLEMKTLSNESLASQFDDGYPAQTSGVPGAPGAKDLEAALKRLTPAEVLARRAILSYSPAGTYTYDEQPTTNALPQGVRTPDSIMSTGSSGISSTNMSTSLQQWRLPEKLQIVKPIEGSQTLHHWSRLATPTLSGLLEERPGVTIRGGRGLDDLGMQVYTLSDVEEDVSEDLPGKQFEASGCTYTYTTSMVMHPDDGLNDLSFLSQSQLSSRMASTSTSRQSSCPPTPHGGLSRKNSCSTFSVNLSLASMLNERGIKAVTPSALNTPAGPNYSPTVTPCNSPEGSPSRASSPEPLFGIFSSGADLIRRKLVGDIERPNRNHQKQQKIMLSRLERRALRSLKLVEKVESIGLENIIATQPNATSQLSSGIANRSSSPMAQLISLKHLHTNANTVVEDICFDRDQIKNVLHKGLNSHTTEKPIVSNDLKTSAVSESNDESFMSTAIKSQQPALTTTADSRVKQLQRQKSRRNLKNGIAGQRPDLGTIGGRIRNDLGRVSSGVRSEVTVEASEETKGNKLDEKTKESQSITQAFVGTVSSLLFGRKGGWL